MRFWVEVSEYGVWGLWNLRFKVWGLGSGVWGLESGVWGLKFRV